MAQQVAAYFRLDQSLLERVDSRTFHPAGPPASHAPASALIKRGVN
ncbi:MAG: hypothetical protein WKG07_24735 [Hymenobacter sp.]